MTIESLTTLLGSFLDQPIVTSFKLMTQGKENTTILATTTEGNIILRMWGETHGYMGSHSQNDIEDEIAFMEFCQLHGVPVPKLFRSKSGNLYEQDSQGHYYTVMEYIDGASPQSFTKDMAKQIAETMARMHVSVRDFTFPQPRSWPGTVLDMTDERIARFEAGEFTIGEMEHAASTEAIRNYRSLLKSCNPSALPRAVIHGDIMWENMKFKDDKLMGIFDFGDCRESYFVEDIAKTLFFAFESTEHSIFGEAGENVPAFLQAYQDSRKLTDAERQSLPLFFLSRIIYQFLGYHAKVSKGMTEYQAKAADTITRYRKYESFFAVLQ
jgi:Ser/Thr protein kinase RdoA (MazF antagonist)